MAAETKIGPPGAAPGCDAQERASVGSEPSAAFTAGPWMLWGLTTIASKPAGQFFKTENALATVHQRDNWRANARLIAAAPELAVYAMRRAADGDAEARELLGRFL